MYRYLLQRVYKRNSETLNFFNSEDFLKTQYENLHIFFAKDGCLGREKKFCYPSQLHISPRNPAPIVSHPAYCGTPQNIAHRRSQRPAEVEPQGSGELSTTVLHRSCRWLR